MELRHLRYFVAVAEEAHVTRAAGRLGVQQPPLSRQIRALEHELGAQLFRRRPHGMELTEAGRTFLGDARAILARAGEAVDAVRRVARGEQGQLSIGVTPTGPFHPLVPGVIRAFRDAFPKVSMSMEEALRDELIGRLRDGRMDAAFLRTTPSEPHGLVVHKLLEEPMVAALPASHAFARRGSARSPLPLKALAHDVFVVYAREQGPAIFQATLAACVRAGFNPHLGQEAPRVTSALSLVAAGFGVSLVPLSMRRLAMEGLVFREISAPAPPTVVLSLAFSRDNVSPVLRAFSALVRRYGRQKISDPYSAGA